MRRGSMGAQLILKAKKAKHAQMPGLRFKMGMIGYTFDHYVFHTQIIKMNSSFKYLSFLILSFLLVSGCEEGGEEIKPEVPN